MKVESVSWKSHVCIPVKAEIAFREIERLKNGNGQVMPADVVAAARSKRNPLHAVFEWDDSKAAEQHRISQARHMLRSIVVVYKDESGEKPPVRAFNVQRIESDSGKPVKVYRSTDDILADPEARMQFLKRALDELIALRKRYRDLQELSIIFRSIDDVLESVKV